MSDFTVATKTFTSVRGINRKLAPLRALTDLATRAFVIEGAESDGREEDGDVEEDGGGHVLQQGFIAANYTCGETNTSHAQLTTQPRKL